MQVCEPAAANSRQSKRRLPQVEKHRVDEKFSFLDRSRLAAPTVCCRRHRCRNKWLYRWGGIKTFERHVWSWPLLLPTKPERVIASSITLPLNAKSLPFPLSMSLFQVMTRTTRMTRFCATDCVRSWQTATVLSLHLVVCSTMSRCEIVQPQYHKNARVISWGGSIGPRNACMVFSYSGKKAVSCKL